MFSNWKAFFSISLKKEWERPNWNVVLVTIKKLYPTMLNNQVEHGSIMQYLILV